MTINKQPPKQPNTTKTPPTNTDYFGAVSVVATVITWPFYFLILFDVPIITTVLIGWGAFIALMLMYKPLSRIPLIHKLAQHISDNKAKAKALASKHNQDEI